MPVFEVTIENNTSKITTVMYVFAEDEQRAKENVSLNGWKVLGVKKLSEKEKSQINLSADGLNGNIAGTPKIDSIGTARQGGNNEPATGKDKIPYGYPTGFSATNPYLTETPAKQNSLNSNPPNNGTSGQVLELKRPTANRTEDNLELLPTSQDLEYIITLNFDLGNVDALPNPNIGNKLSELAKNRKYIVFGHADEVKVGKNTVYKNNYTLSFLRAEFVKKMITEYGIPEENIRVVGLGVKYPLDNSKESSFANRRAEIYGFRTQK